MIQHQQFIFADKYYLIPRIGSKDYVQKILDICKKEKINLIVPTIDTELQILSEKKNILKKIHLPRY